MIRAIGTRTGTITVVVLALLGGALALQAALVDGGPALAQYETPTPDGELTICHVDDDRRITLTLPESEARILLDNYETTTLGPCEAPLPPDTGSGTMKRTTRVFGLLAVVLAGGLFGIGTLISRRRAC